MEHRGQWLEPQKRRPMALANVEGSSEPRRISYWGGLWSARQEPRNTTADRPQARERLIMPRSLLGCN